jgi:ribosomal protein S18 acetylase RimI-like enzyme
MTAVVVRRILVEEVEKLREVRQEALRNHPEAFSADPDREAAQPIERWRELIATLSWFVAEDEGDGAWAGIAVFSRDRHSAKTEHVGSLGSMYVRASYRGRGIGDRLVEAVRHEAAQCISQLRLTVNAENKSAIALYERQGFIQYGYASRSLKIGERYFDELEMALEL